MKHLTTAQAWDKIAEAYARYETTGSPDADNIARAGLCAALIRLAYHHYITLHQHWAMQLEIYAALDELVYACVLAPYGPGPDRAGLRAMLAGFYAEEARDNERKGA